MREIDKKHWTRIPREFIGTNTERLAMNADTLTPGSNYYEDTGNAYVWDGAAWVLKAMAAGKTINENGDVVNLADSIGKKTDVKNTNVTGAWGLISMAKGLYDSLTRYLGFSGNLVGDAVGIEAIPKGGIVTVWSGLAASKSEVETTVEVDMRDYTAGSMSVKENSGSGSWVFAIYSKDTPGGVFIPSLNTDGSARTVAIPDGGGEVSLTNLRAKYYKFVPTLTGASNVDVTFTPNPM